ncbi:MAG: PIN domain-containing protein, partial [Chloroflexota bacterium]
MPNVFDLSKVSRLVESEHPVCILVIDTNVLMDEPDPVIWNVTMGPTLFVLSDGTIHELEYIRQKNESREKAGSREKADKAVKSLANLFKKGKITEGIPIQAGWVIGVPSPKQDQLEMELKQIEDIVKVFKRSDAKLLILTKECDQLFESTPVILETAEVNLYNESQINGIPCHLCTGFPIENLKEVDEKLGTWNQALKGMQATTKEKSIEVEVTLTAQRCAPSWLTLFTGTKRVMTAEGRGVIRVGNEVRPFLWNIFFYPKTFGLWLLDEGEGLTNFPSIHLDFLGRDDFDQDL